MIVVISQPMLFPWVGMLEQIRATDVFVCYPDVQFSKGSFVNRVQIKTAQGVRWLTVPLANLHLGQRINEVGIDYQRHWRQDHLQLLAEAYTAARYRDDMLDLVKSVYGHDHENIGSLSASSQMALCRYFGLDHQREFKSSETMGIGGSSSQRVLDIVQSLAGGTYLTGHGASHYLDHELFEQAHVRVEYMNYAKIPYPQLHGEFTPYVSALDLVANVGPTGIDYIRPRSIYWKDFLSDK
ncbi:WbqC-like protein family protein [Dyella sp. OK004]|uniref:WbqC family protein n=1 Tax=Dyella sp. OK004 TaxID=1855292 RepID=UPI0008E6A5D5|nr:WbqC family protein [Dyella sp. OK004]SFS05912.1 WbqC-like protein family protein [Dyella sp. OK004]